MGGVDWRAGGGDVYCGGRRMQNGRRRICAVGGVD